MQNNLDEQLDTIERNTKGWRSLTFYDRSLLQELGGCLQLCLAVPSENTFLNLVINRHVQAFDMFAYVAASLFKQWYHYKRVLALDQLTYLTLVGIVNRRVALSLQNDNDVTEEDTEQSRNNLEHHQRARELLFDHDPDLIDILMQILPTISENDFDFIEMILPWYEAYIYFEHSYIDSTLDERFLLFYRQIIQCLKSDEYERSLVLIENHTTMITTVRHRFYLGVCTMAMGIHVNCDENECEEAKNLLELYLPRYISFIHCFLIQDAEHSSNTFACLTGIITFVVNYTLLIDNENNRQLLLDLFSLTLRDHYYSNIRLNWSTYETILFDSIISYLIVYCFDDRQIVRDLLQNHDHYLKYFEQLIDQAQNFGNRRIAIMSQLLLLIFTSCVKNEDLTERLFLSCLTYIEMSLDNHHSYHYNRIPMSMFFKSLVHIVKYDYIQEIIRRQYWDLFIQMIINYDKNDLHPNVIYRECVMITLTILWTLSFNEQAKKLLKQMEQTFSETIGKINRQTHEPLAKQATCGLLFNLDRLNLSRNSISLGPNFGKTIGISYDSSDHGTVQMIEQELNKAGHRVWTTYDHMNDHFIPSFISSIRTTQYLIVCLSDMYRSNNRCRTELLYATSSGHRVLSWKVHPPTNNSDDDEQLRQRGIETLLKRISLNEYENLSTGSTPDIATAVVEIPSDSRWHRAQRRRTRNVINLEHWSNTEVIHWCQSIDLPGFSKLIAQYDGPSVIRLYDFCKHNSAETIATLNRDLHGVCDQESIPAMEITVHEYIRFQIEVEKLLSKSSRLASSSTSLYKSSSSLSASKLNLQKKRSKLKSCHLF